LKKNVTIKEKTPSQDILDFKYLKQLALEQIQKLSGSLWTDYNIHDPGITILEVLCYAATELGYRSSYSVKDLLAHPAKVSENFSTLIESSEILTSACVTINDYRRLLLDIEGIRNAILKPATEYPDFRGIYNIYLELLPDYNSDFTRQAIVEEVGLTLNNNRNLCEDFNEIRFFEYDPIGLELNLEINKDANISEVLGNIFHVLLDYVAPTPTYYSLEELLERNYPVDKIFEGPLLKNGFLLDDDLSKLDVRENLYTSDLIHNLMDIKGVNYIKNFLFIDSDDAICQWLCKVKQQKTPQIDLKRIKINFFILDKKLNLDFDYNFYFDKALKSDKEKSGHKRLIFKMESGEYRNLSRYNSIQNNFPEVYGIGEIGLHPSASKHRKAKARQLKGYLLLFDQILANFFSQIDNLNKLFSTSEIQNTYFTQPLFEIPGIEYLYKPFTDHCFTENINLTNSIEIKKEWARYKKNNIDFFQIKYDQIVESHDTFIDRRNKILSHLLARFALSIDDLLFFENDTYQNDLNFSNIKSNILNNITRFSRNRFSSANITPSAKLNTNYTSGFEFNYNMLMRIDHDSTVYNQINLKDVIKIKKLHKKVIPYTINQDEATNDFIFINIPKHEIWKILFRYGSVTDYYHVEYDKGQKGYIVSLRQSITDAEIRMKNIFKTQEAAELAINQISDRLNRLNKQCESLLLMEHIMVRPPDQLPLFGFIVNDKAGTPLFNSEELVSMPERKRIIDDIFSMGKEKNSYKVVSEGINQYRLLLADAFGNPLVKTMHYYESEESSQKDIDNFIAFVKDMDTSPELKSGSVQYYTKYNNIFNETTDPFSFLLTILIPNWPDRYQNPRLKSYIENLIYKDIPSHIIPIIRWVDMNELYRYKTVYETFIQEKMKNIPDFKKLTSLLDEFMLLIAD
jgi:hypothetical protein